MTADWLNGYDGEAEAWEEFVDRRNRPPLERSDGQLILGRTSADHRTAVVPREAWKESHPDHAIYVAWVAMEKAIQAREERVQVEELEAADEADARWRAMYGPR